MRVSRWKVAVGMFVLISSQVPVWENYAKTMGNSSEPVLGPLLFFTLMAIPLAGAVLFAWGLSEKTG